YPCAAVRRKPTEWTAVADPGHKAAVEMHGGAILRPVRTHDRRIYRNDSFGWESIIECKLDWHSLLGNDNAAQMSLWLSWATQWDCRVIAPKSGWTERGMNLVRKLTHVQRV